VSKEKQKTAIKWQFATDTPLFSLKFNTINRDKYMKTFTFYCLTLCITVWSGDTFTTAV